eukprot:808746-Lingulodinium_polyedra.AAC.1
MTEGTGHRKGLKKEAGQSLISWMSAGHNLRRRLKGGVCAFAGISQTGRRARKTKAVHVRICDVVQQRGMELRRISEWQWI